MDAIVLPGQLPGRFDFFSGYWYNRQKGGMAVKVVTLAENTACREDLAAEHGLSLYIETGGCRILFDFGQTDAFLRNAEKLGVDLRRVDLAVLSHGHNDHGGGLARFLQINASAPVYLSRHAFEPHFSRSGSFIGLDPSLADSSRLIFTDGSLDISDELSICSCGAPPEDASGQTVLENGVLRPETFRHEQYLLVREQGKRILFSGCSHKGIGQIAEAFRPDVLVGGFHLLHTPEETRLRAAAERLLQCPTVYYTGHCTGQAQFDYLKEQMGPRLRAFHTGSVLLL